MLFFKQFTQSVENGAPRLISSCTFVLSPSLAQWSNIFPRSITETGGFVGCNKVPPNST